MNEYTRRLLWTALHRATSLSSSCLALSRSLGSLTTLLHDALRSSTGATAPTTPPDSSPTVTPPWLAETCPCATPPDPAPATPGAECSPPASSSASTGGGAGRPGRAGGHTCGMCGVSCQTPQRSVAITLTCGIVSRELTVCYPCLQHLLRPVPTGHAPSPAQTGADGSPPAADCPSYAGSSGASSVDDDTAEHVPLPDLGGEG